MKYLIVTKDYKNIILSGAVIREGHKAAFVKAFPGIELAPVDAASVFVPWVCYVSDFTNNCDDSVAGYSVATGEAIYR